MIQKTCFVAIIAMLTADYSSAQPRSSRLFILIETNAPCDHRVVSINAQASYCIPPGPVIPLSGFKSAKSTIIHGRRIVDVTFSEEAIQTMDQIAKVLPKSRLVLVVDDTALGIFDSGGKFLSQMNDKDLAGVITMLERHIRE
jgi:hypothetical protein